MYQPPYNPLDENFFESCINKSPSGYGFFKILQDTCNHLIDCEILTVNEAFVRITGLRAEALVGQSLSHILKGSRKSTYDWFKAFEDLVGLGKLEDGSSHQEFQHYFHTCSKWCRVSLHIHMGSTIVVQISELPNDQVNMNPLAMEEAEARYKALYEKGPVGVAYHKMIYNDQGKPIDYLFIDANENYKALTGVDPTGKLVTEAFPGIEEDPFDWISVFGQVVTTGETIRFEQYLAFNQRWYDCFAYKYKQGHFVVMFTEITARKQMENDLVESKARFLQIAESVEEVFYLVTPKSGELLYVNPAYEKIWGKTCQSLFDCPTSFLDSVHEADKARVVKAFEAIENTGGFSEEYRIIRPDGQMRWVKSRVFPLKDQNGTIHRHTGTAVDITQYKNIEGKLRENLKDLRESQRIAHIGTWRLDLESDEVVWSTELYKMYGFDPQNPVPPYSEHAKLFTADSWKLLAESLEKTRTLGIPYELELMTVNNDGSNGWMWVRGEAEWNEDGVITAIWGAAQDITSRKAIEADLIRARDDAESASSAKSQFLSNMSHEIRTPMNGFIGTLHLMEMTALSDEQRELIEIAKTSSKSLLTLVNDILDYSKLEADQMAFDIQPFNLRDLVLETANLFRIPANIKGLVLETTVEDGLPLTVLGDSFRLKQVLSNLLGNAVKFTSSGSVMLKVSEERGLDGELTHRGPSVNLKFEVSDTGIGISEGLISKLFTRFFQGDNSNTRTYGGSGLGLAICKGIIEKMKGEIWVESQPGLGSHFIFTCRLDAVYEEPQALEIKGGPVDVVRGMTLLLAEDDMVNRLIIQKVASKKGWHVVTAENGEQAVELFKAQAFDLVLMDVQMPVMNGYIATGHLRAYERELGREQELAPAVGQGKRTPIIAMTAYAIAGDIEKCIEAGMDDYLPKPVDFDAFYEMVNKWVKP